MENMKRFLMAFFFAISFVQAQTAVVVDATIISENQVFEIESIQKATHKVDAKILILNEEGQKKHGIIQVGYNPYVKIKKLEAQLTDGMGNIIQRKLNADDIRDFSASDGFSLATDDRVKYAFPRTSQFPYILNYSYELELEGFIRIPGWIPIDPRSTVERSTYTLVAPPHFNVKYATKNLNIQPAIEHIFNKKYYKWEVNNLSVFKPEVMMPNPMTQLPQLILGMDEFVYGGVQGKSKDWQEFGQWFASLYQSRQVLSDAKKDFLNNLVKDAKTDLEKAKLVYEHLQKTTRYISVQLGIGGFQPFDAKYVETNQYGDCKALSNYLMAMLKEVGVTAYPALIQAGSDVGEIIEEIPASQFNHVILALPQPDSTYIWLEATSQDNNFGHLGDFTEDRLALLITPEGGKLVRTYVSNHNQNRNTNEVKATLDATGNVIFEVHRVRTGNAKDDSRMGFRSIADNERRKRLLESFDFAAPNLISVDFSDLENNDDVYDLKYTVEAARYANKTGTRLFLKPCAFGKFNVVTEPSEPRKYDFDFGYAETRSDQITYILPEGFVVEALPAPVKISLPFADYEASVVKNTDGTLLFTRKYVKKMRRVEAKMAAEVYNFYRVAGQADQMMVVLKRSI